MKRILACLAVALFTLSAQAGSNPLAERSRRIKVAVLAGHQVELVRIGMLVFGNKRGLAAAPDGQLADAVYDEIRAELLKEGRFDVEREALSPGEWEGLANKAQQLANSYFGTNLKGLADDLAPIRRRCDCDALLLAVHRNVEDQGGTNQSYTGFAWVARSGLGDDVTKTALSPHLRLYLVDPARGNVVEHSPSRADATNAATAVEPPVAAWPREMQAIGNDQWVSLVDGFRQALRGTMRFPLYDLGLRPSCSLHFYRLFDRLNRQRQNQDPFQSPDGPPLPPGSDPARC